MTLVSNPPVQNAVADFAARFSAGAATIESVRDDARERALECQDYIADPKSFAPIVHPDSPLPRLLMTAAVRGDAAARILGEFATDGLPLTPNGLRSLAAWAGISAAAARSLSDAALYGADTQARAVLVSYLQWGLDKSGDRRQGPALVRTRGNEIRAVLSQDYAPINHSWLLDLFAELSPSALVAKLRYSSTGDEVSGMLLPGSGYIVTPDDGDYFAGVEFSNSEVGTSTLRIAPAVYRVVCTNGMVRAVRKGDVFSIRHRAGDDGLDYGKLALSIGRALGQLAPRASAIVEDLLATRDTVFASAIETLSLIDLLAEDAKLPDERRVLWAEGWIDEGADENAFAVVNGLTRAARADSSPAASKVEELAGHYADQHPDWWRSRAKRASEEVSDERLAERYPAILAELLD